MVREATSLCSHDEGGGMIAPVRARRRAAAKPGGPKSSGLRALLYHTQAQRAARRLLEALEATGVAVILDRAEVELVMADVIAEEMADARGMSATVSQMASREDATASRQRKLVLLHCWLDTNLARFSGRLEDCAESAVASLRGLGWSVSTVRREISLYRRNRKLDGC